MPPLSCLARRVYRYIATNRFALSKCRGGACRVPAPVDGAAAGHPARVLDLLLARHARAHAHRDRRRDRSTGRQRPGVRAHVPAPGRSARRPAVAALPRRRAVRRRAAGVRRAFRRRPLRRRAAGSRLAADAALAGPSPPRPGARRHPRRGRHPPPRGARRQPGLGGPRHRSAHRARRGDGGARPPGPPATARPPRHDWPARGARRPDRAAGLAAGDPARPVDRAAGAGTLR